MAVARIRAERSLGIIGRILLPKCLLEWHYDELHINVIKRSFILGALVDISRHFQISRKTDDLHLSAIHIDTKKINLFLFQFLLALLTNAALPLFHKQVMEVTHLTNELVSEVITLGAGAEILL